MQEHNEKPEPKAETKIEQETPQLNAAEKEVAKLLDAYIEKDASGMRKCMTDSLQAVYDFDVLESDKFAQKPPISFRFVNSIKEDGALSVTVEVLYEKQKNGKQSTKQYYYELIKDSSSDKLLINAETDLSANKPFYKKPLFWIAGILGLVILTAGLFAIFSARSTSQTQKSISAGWGNIVDSAEVVDTAGKNATKDEDSFSNYSQKLEEFEGVIDKEKTASDQLSQSGSDSENVENYKSALSALQSYIALAVEQSNNLEDRPNSAITTLEESADKASTATNTFQDGASFITNKMPSAIFDIADVLASQQEKLEEVANKAQEAEDAKANAAAKDAADKTAVTNSINGFNQGFIAGNGNAMRQYMTTGFQGEYNFNQLTPAERQYQYPSSFRIINTTKQPDGSYNSQVNILFKYTDNPNQYTQGYTYSVISQNNKWLINDEKIGNGF